MPFLLPIVTNALWLGMWLASRREHKRAIAALVEFASLADTYRLSLLEVHTDDRAHAIFHIGDDLIAEMIGARTFVEYACGLVADRHDVIVTRREK